ncbi:TetR/AcrR family transcriptional regulator [Lacticaseibacillus porcinae]|uniref:TetR/AcrR family transcriptional regulator n=1 Tax=Lacticaseibacillus porcinae TaxID=1123687 RepID=UPI000F79C965|nr:TetR/AcrR family transcriptional regulator [Lacticaseibacillus porcinae]
MRTKDETKATKILDATAAIILKDGAAGVSTVKVAKQVGISQSNVYLYFKNKEALLLSVYHREIKRIQATGDLKRVADESLPIEVRVKAYIRAIYQDAMRHPDGLTLIQQIKFLFGQYDNNPFLNEDNTQNLVTELYHSAQQKGALKNAPISVLMSLVFSVIHTHSLNVQRGVYAADAYSFDDIFAVIWQGIHA